MTKETFDLITGICVSLAIFLLIYVNLPQKLSDDRDEKEIDKKKTSL